MDEQISDWCKMNGVSYEKCKGIHGTYYVFEKDLDMGSDEGVSFAIESLFGEQKLKSKVTLASFVCENNDFILKYTIDYLSGLLLGQ